MEDRFENPNDILFSAPLKLAFESLNILSAT